MNDIKSSVERLKTQIGGGLIVSCQAPANSPLARPEIIAALAETAELNGAVGVRIDSPAHIWAVRRAVKIPIIGIYKILRPESEVYITPFYQSAVEIAEAGADIIALDATARARPNGESLPELCDRIRTNLKLPVMADVANFDEGVFAAEQLGCTFVGTTLSGYTRETEQLLEKPDFELIEKLARRISVPIIAEGRLTTPDDVKKAFDSGAFAVVVGNAITGIDNQIRRFAAAGRNKLTKFIV
jgi:N-acylglucosamine-6-phosphate 2-epimerase